jgi:hypothetical protein
MVMGPSATAAKSNKMTTYESHIHLGGADLGALGVAVVVDGDGAVSNCSKRVTI